MREKVRIPNTAPARHLLPYLESLDESKVYSNFGVLNFQYVKRLRTERFGSQFHITSHSSGTQALIASILATAGYARPGKKLCLISSYTFIATVAAAKNCGYEPVLVDIDPDNLMMDLDSHMDDIPWEEVGLILPTCAYGILGHTQDLITLAADKNIPIVIDGAAAFDTLTADLELGKNAVFCLSTHATKSYNSGEGGLAICKRPDLSRKIRAISNFGMDGSRTSKYHGINSKMSEYHAAVGLANLDLWSYHLNRLSSVRERYRLAFQQRGVDTDALRYNSNCSLAYFLVNTPPNQLLLSELQKNGVDFRYWYGSGVHKSQLYSNNRRTRMTTTNRLAEQVLGLPMHIFLDDSDINLIADILCFGESAVHAVL